MTTKTNRDKRVEEKIRCDACPVMCFIADGKSGACDRYANENGQLLRLDPLLVMQRRVDEGGELVRFLDGADDWDYTFLDCLLYNQYLLLDRITWQPKAKVEGE